MLIRQIQLLFRIVKTELLLRDQGTFLGFLWTLLNPIFLFATLYIVFAKIHGGEPDNFKAYLLIGILLWNFFATATSVGASILGRRANYISNSPLPPSLFIIGAVFAVMVTSLCEGALGFAYLSFYLHITSAAIIQFCEGLVLLGILAIGVSSFLSVAGVYFSDSIYLWGMALRIGFFLTPVFYSLSSIDQQYVKYIKLNPLTTILNAARESISYQPQSTELLPYVVLISLLLAVLGLATLQSFRYRILEG